MRIIIHTIFGLLLISFSVGCASIASGWKSLISGESESAPARSLASAAPAYSNQNQMIPGNYRDYKRTTHKTLSDAAQLEAKSGSLWVMEGQGAYLFSQNVVRLIGDPLTVTIEGDPKDQLNQKAQVISDLLLQLEARRMKALARPEAPKPEDAIVNQATATNPTVPSDAGRAPAGEAEKMAVKMVPTRVVERMVDGNYRVRGAQPFMIGAREYKVIVTGIVRAEDFNESGISATQLLDPNFDIVSSRGSEVR